MAPLLRRPGRIVNISHRDCTTIHAPTYNTTSSSIACFSCNHRLDLRQMCREHPPQSVLKPSRQCTNMLHKAHYMPLLIIEALRFSKKPSQFEYATRPLRLRPNTCRQSMHLIIQHPCNLLTQTPHAPPDFTNHLRMPVHFNFQIIL